MNLNQSDIKGKIYEALDLVHPDVWFRGRWITNACYTINRYNPPLTCSDGIQYSRINHCYRNTGRTTSMLADAIACGVVESWKSGQRKKVKIGIASPSSDYSNKLVRKAREMIERVEEKRDEIYLSRIEIEFVPMVYNSSKDKWLCPISDYPVFFDHTCFGY